MVEPVARWGSQSNSGSGIAVAGSWWLGIGEAGRGSRDVLTRAVLLPDRRRCSWHPSLVFTSPGEFELSY